MKCLVFLERNSKDVPEKIPTIRQRLRRRLLHKNIDTQTDKHPSGMEAQQPVSFFCSHQHQPQRQRQILFQTVRARYGVQHQETVSADMVSNLQLPVPHARCCQHAIISAHVHAASRLESTSGIGRTASIIAVTHSLACLHVRCKLR